MSCYLRKQNNLFEILIIIKTKKDTDQIIKTKKEKIHDY